MKMKPSMASVGAAHAGLEFARLSGRDDRCPTVEQNGNIVWVNGGVPASSQCLIKSEPGGTRTSAG